MSFIVDALKMLTADGYSKSLVGCVWRPAVEGPSVIAVRAEGLLDITAAYPTVRDLCETADPAASLAPADGPPVCTLAEAAANTPIGTRDKTKPHLLAPIDLQAVKAAGVTFAVSMIERIIEERAGGDANLADRIRKDVQGIISTGLEALKSLSEQAFALKNALIEKGLWSQYLKVGIGPDAEIFTKAQVILSVGTGMDAGRHHMSSWNSPEPEVIRAANSEGRIDGAMLGSDVNLRDVEGRSALLLSRVNDNNAACAIVPFLRLFDDSFDLDFVRSMTVSLTVDGPNGFRLERVSRMTEISRNPADLTEQLIGANHRYPERAALFPGTLFAPTKDHNAEGQAFTHHVDDTVTIACPQPGALTNRMKTCSDCEPWTFGTSHLLRNLACREMLE